MKEVTHRELMYRMFMDILIEPIQDLHVIPIEGGARLEYEDIFCIIKEEDLYGE